MFDERGRQILGFAVFVILTGIYIASLFYWPGIPDGFYILLGLSLSFAFLQRGVGELKDSRWGITWGIVDSLASLVFFGLALRLFYSAVIPPAYDAVAVLPLWMAAFLICYALYRPRR